MAWVLAASLATPALVDGAAADTAPVTQAAALSVDVDRATHIALAQPATTAFVANPDIADIQADNPRMIVVYGRKAGVTTVYVTTKDGHVSAYPIRVQRPTDQPLAALKARAPQANLQVTGSPGGLTVSGAVASPREAAAVAETARQFLGDKDKLNLGLAVTQSVQVNLQVRIAEVSRQVSRSLGFNWSAILNNGSTAAGLMIGRNPVGTGFADFIRDPSLSQLSSVGIGYTNANGSTNISALVDALQSAGLVTVLAEPNLTATSGESASFLAGGEIPVPIAQALNQVTIEWKRFGVSLDFTPTVLDGGRISIKVQPEVSELSNTGAVVINNIKIPSLVVRRAQTTVELASGQSFAIAGLFMNNGSSNSQSLPGLAKVPVLGALFGSRSFQRGESELVIIVTPYIVRPVDHLADLHLPTDGLAFANELEQIMDGRTDASVPRPVGAAQPHLSGPASFILEDKP
jgi:pilus assembly protein CpaC